MKLCNGQNNLESLAIGLVQLKLMCFFQFRNPVYQCFRHFENKRQILKDLGCRQSLEQKII